jgi:hypothetical protein
MALLKSNISTVHDVIISLSFTDDASGDNTSDESYEP